jgi:hypothetical protein
MSPAADFILVVHALFVIFVVGGLPAIWLGAAFGKPWARNFTFRASHLAAIGFVAAESLVGQACPLTIWEDSLRGVSDERGFVARWIHSWLFWPAPPWVFTSAYVAFGALVAWTWWRFPPRRSGREA